MYVQFGTVPVTFVSFINSLSSSPATILAYGARKQDKYGFPEISPPQMILQYYVLQTVAIRLLLQCYQSIQTVQIHFEFQNFTTACLTTTIDPLPKPLLEAFFHS